MDALSKGDENYLLPEHSIKNKNDIILDNQILNRNFSHLMTDLYDQYFRKYQNCLIYDKKIEKNKKNNGYEKFKNLSYYDI